jgi:hypothetical protein
MAQMSIHQVAGRAQIFPPPPTPNAPAPQATPAASASAAAASTQPFDPAAIPGGRLRPGAVEQTTFRQRMMALNRADAPTGQTVFRSASQAAQAPFQGGGPLIDTTPRAPLVGPAPSQKMPSIPTLTPAQLAALGVDVSSLPEFQQDPAADPAPQFTTPQAAPFFDAATEPAAETVSPAAPQLAATQEPAASPNPASVAPAAPPEEAAEAAAAQQQAALPADAAPANTAAPQGPMPGARLGADGVWELPRHPDRDERDWLQGMNAKWRIVENPESVKLFLGEDGKFGFDDFLDIINPLQHIPLVNIAYRELTGDTVNGAAQLLGAIPFGPLSVASNLADIAMRSETGAGLAENAIAMIFGGGTGGGPDAGGDIATASGRMTQVAEIRRGSNK